MFYGSGWHHVNIAIGCENAMLIGNIPYFKIIKCFGVLISLVFWLARKHACEAQLWRRVYSLPSMSLTWCEVSCCPSQYQLEGVLRYVGVCVSVYVGSTWHDRNCMTWMFSMNTHVHAEPLVPTCLLRSWLYYFVFSSFFRHPSQLLIKVVIPHHNLLYSDWF